MKKAKSGRTVQSLKECRNCDRWKEAKEKIRILELLGKTIDKMKTKLEAADFKPTFSDYLKVMQLEQELERDEVKEIKVTWVDPAATLPEK
jgi:hypothetical protein